MSRYVTRRPRAALVEFDYYTEPLRLPHLEVDDHGPVDTGLVDTGLVDIHGDTIMRLPNPVGFGKDEDW